MSADFFKEKLFLVLLLNFFFVLFVLSTKGAFSAEASAAPASRSKFSSTKGAFLETVSSDSAVTSTPSEDSIEDLGFFKKDSSYYIQKMSAHWDLIFSEEFQSISPYLINTSLAVDKTFSSLFKRQPDFRTGHIFFSSPRYQIANALASFFTTAFVKIYPSNTPIYMDLWSLSDWSSDTLIHELNHIYQLSQNFNLNNYFRRLLSYISLSPDNWEQIGSLIHRNNYLPLWILEGDSVLTESIYGSGGRLWSGASRAFVLAQIKEDEINVKRLLNFYSDPFSDMENYLHGGFFFAYLESLYGLKKVKNFFNESARLFPIGYYGLKISFQKAFNADIQQLFEGYKKHYSRLAEKQKSAGGKVLFKSKTFAPINSDEENLYFLISDLKSPAELIVWNKQKQKFKKRKAYLPISKVFKRKGRYVSVSSISTGANAVEYTVVREKFKPIAKYNSQYVMDFYKDQTLSLDMKKNHQGNPLNLGGEFYDWIHSSALIDAKGSVYYFKQEKEKRALYKNKKPVAEFQAYFSYPVEVTPKEVYFIAPTAYGSSLFVYREGQGFERLSESDRIVSARKTKENQFLVSEISSSHYEYKLISTEKPDFSNQKMLNSKDFNTPVFYKDLPEKKNLFQNSFLSQSEMDRQKNSSSSTSLSGSFSQKAQHLQKEETQKNTSNFKPYHSFSNLIFKNFGLSVFDSIHAFLNFEDPLSFNSLLLSGLLFKQFQFFNLSYSHKKYRPQFEISLDYNKGFLSAGEDKALIDTFQDLGFLQEEDRYSFLEQVQAEKTQSEKNSQEESSPTRTIELSEGVSEVSRILKKRRAYLEYQTRSVSLGLSYPLFRSSESSLKTGSSITFGQRQFNQNTWINYFNNRGSLSYSFIRSYPYAYSFYKKRQLAGEYNLLFLNTKDFHLSYSIKGDFLEDLGKEFFLNLEGRALWALWNRTLISLPIRFSEDFQWSYALLKESVQNLYQLDITVFKVFNNNRYRFLRAPLYFNRFAPLAGLSLLSFQKHKELNHHFAFIPFLGAETEFAFLMDHNVLKLGFLFETPLFTSNQDLFTFRSPYFQFRLWVKTRL